MKRPDTDVVLADADFCLVMGDGEAAGLAMAITRNAVVATSDENRCFQREAYRRLGGGRTLNTSGLLVLAMRIGEMTEAEVDYCRRRSMKTGTPVDKAGGATEKNKEKENGEAEDLPRHQEKRRILAG